MGLFGKKKTGGGFSPAQRAVLDGFDGSDSDDDILERGQTELHKVSVDMALAGPRLDLDLDALEDELASDDEGAAYKVEAPSGRLGVAFEGRTSTMVREVFFDSPLVGAIRPGDVLASVNGVEVSGKNYLIHVAAADDGANPRTLGFVRGRRRTPVVSPPCGAVPVRVGTLVELLAEDEVETLVAFDHGLVFSDAHRRCCGGVFAVSAHREADDALLLSCPSPGGAGLWFPRQACVIDTWTDADARREGDVLEQACGPRVSLDSGTDVLEETARELVRVSLDSCDDQY